ncbi:kiwellin [Quercus suber]|uniref:Kiwellin n=1 Tax=Quercus suber TaxID=58331 RepID=A0AAW0KAK1_QUESU
MYKENDSDCCVQGKLYTIYKCSPQVSGHTKAKLTINSFRKVGMVMDHLNVTISTTQMTHLWWHCQRVFNNKQRCLNYITIYGNGRSVQAKVVDECESTMGVMLTMITSLHVLTILLMPLKQCGRPWEYQKVIGETWTYPGLMLKLNSNIF